MALNGLDLAYPLNPDGTTALSDIVDRAAAGRVSKEQLMDWFDRHKVQG
jgi:hypothetical protein